LIQVAKLVHEPSAGENPETEKKSEQKSPTYPSCPTIYSPEIHLLWFSIPFSLLPFWLFPYIVVLVRKEKKRKSGEKPLPYIDSHSPPPLSTKYQPTILVTNMIYEPQRIQAAALFSPRYRMIIYFTESAKKIGPKQRQN